MEESPVHMGPDLGLFKALDVITGLLKLVTCMEMQKVAIYGIFKVVKLFQNGWKNRSSGNAQ